MCGPKKRDGRREDDAIDADGLCIWCRNNLGPSGVKKFREEQRELQDMR